MHKAIKLEKNNQKKFPNSKEKKVRIAAFELPNTC